MTEELKNYYEEHFKIKPCPMCDRRGYVIRGEGERLLEYVCPKCQGKRFYCEEIKEK